MIRYLGRLIGSAVGLLGGPLGCGFGFVIGYLLDLVGEDLRARRAWHRLADRREAPSDSRRLYPMAASLIACVMIEECAEKSPSASPYGRGALSDEELEQLVASIREHGGEHLSRATVARVARVTSGMVQQIETDAALRSCASLLDRCRLEAAVMASGPLARSVPRQAALRGLARRLGFPPGWCRSHGLSARPLDETACRILGVSESVTVPELRKVYRRLAAQFHPDALGDLGDDERRAAEAAFIRIRGAYDTIHTELTRDDS